MTIRTKPVLVIGSLAFDDLDMPSGNYRDVLGGAAVYASLAASVLASGGVRIVGIVGEDFPADHLATLRSRGIDTEGVERAAGQTFRWHGRYSDNLSSRTTLDTRLNVFADFAPKIPTSYRDSPIVLLGNIHPSLQRLVLEQVSHPDLVVADTMNFWMSENRTLSPKCSSASTFLLLTTRKPDSSRGIQNLVKAAADIRRRGPESARDQARGIRRVALRRPWPLFRPGVSARTSGRSDRCGGFVRWWIGGVSVRAWRCDCADFASRHVLRGRLWQLLCRGNRALSPACDRAT